MIEYVVRTWNISTHGCDEALEKHLFEMTENGWELCEILDAPSSKLGITDRFRAIFKREKRRNMGAIWKENLPRKLGG